MDVDYVCAGVVHLCCRGKRRRGVANLVVPKRPVLRLVGSLERRHAHIKMQVKAAVAAAVASTAVASTAADVEGGWSGVGRNRDLASGVVGSNVAPTDTGRPTAPFHRRRGLRTNSWVACMT